MEIHKVPFQYICTKNSVIYNEIHPGSIPLHRLCLRWYIHETLYPETGSECC